jgi:hypothetical protein
LAARQRGHALPKEPSAVHDDFMSMLVYIMMAMALRWE